MRRLAVALRSSLISLWRSVDVEGSLLLFAVVGGAALAYSWTGDPRAALAVLVIAAGVGGVVLAVNPKPKAT